MRNLDNLKNDYTTLPEWYKKYLEEEIFPNYKNIGKDVNWDNLGEYVSIKYNPLLFCFETTLIYKDEGIQLGKNMMTIFQFPTGRIAPYNGNDKFEEIKYIFNRKLQLIELIRFSREIEVRIYQIQNLNFENDKDLLSVLSKYKFPDGKGLKDFAIRGIQNAITRNNITIEQYKNLKEHVEYVIKEISADIKANNESLLPKYDISQQNQVKTKNYNLHWNENFSASDFIELIAALHSSKAVIGEKQELKSAFCYIFNIDIPNFYNLQSAFKTRANDN
jgi:hypothetical protein